jgi:hypothetical protein
MPPHRPRGDCAWRGSQPASKWAVQPLFLGHPATIYKHHPNRKSIGWINVKAQHWVPTGKRSTYWAVTAPPEPPASPERPDEMSWQERELQTEKERLEKQDQDRVRVGNNADNTTPWFYGQSGPRHSPEKSRRLLGLTRYRKLDPEVHLIFSAWSDRRTMLVSSEFDKVLDRALSTLGETNNSIL